MFSRGCGLITIEIDLEPLFEQSYILSFNEYTGEFETFRDQLPEEIHQEKPQGHSYLKT